MVSLFYKGRPLLIAEPENTGNPSILVPDFDANDKCKKPGVLQIGVCCAIKND